MNKPIKRKHCLCAAAYFQLLLLIILPCLSSATVNIYSAREEALIKPVLDKFSQKTGIKTQLLTASADALLERLSLEGKDSPADLIITIDAGRLYRAKQSGLLQSIESKTLEKTIPAQYRDSDMQWFGLSLRARVIVVVKEKISPIMNFRYESLADKQWHNRLCIRSSDNIYNQSLVASMIHANGEAKTFEWLKGLVQNFARKPTGGDRDQILAAHGGLCDVAVVNTYYLAGMFHSANEAQQTAAQSMQVIWPNQQDRGTHVNVSGAGVTRVAKNKQDAIKLLEFLVSKEAQNWYSDANNEYPVRTDLKPNATLTSWGEFKADTLPLNQLGKLNADAVKLMDKAGWQ